MRTYAYILRSFIGATFCAAILTNAHAQFLFGNPTGHYETSLFTNSTVGASFTVGSQPIQVTALGVYDDNGQNGLLESHQIAVWGTSGQLTGAVVPSGTGSTLVGFYRYVPITPLTLSAGATYTVGAFFDIIPPSFDWEGASGSAPVDPAISAVTLGLYSGHDNPVFMEPTQNIGFPIWAANLQFTIVPEPGSAALIAGGGGLLLLLRRRNLK